MQIRQLGQTDLHVSTLGFGTAGLGHIYGAIDEDEGIATVRAALDHGINFFDTSPYYGTTRSETVLGQALRGIERDRYVLATKIGRYGMAEFDFSAARVHSSINESLERLQVESVDILHCHDIEFGDLSQIVGETLPALREVQRQGKCRYVGITGLPLGMFPWVLERADVDVILSYCHYTLLDDTLEALIPYLQHKAVSLINASPLSMALLSSDPPDWHPASDAIKQCVRQAEKYCRERGVELPTLALEFALHHPCLPTTLTGMVTRQQLQKNLLALDNMPDAHLLNAVQRILEPVHNQTWPSGRPENNNLPVPTAD